MNRKEQITLAESKTLRANSAQWRKLYSKMDDKALLSVVDNFLNNIFIEDTGTYDSQLVHTIVPLLVKRIDPNHKRSNDRY